MLHFDKDDAVFATFAVSDDGRGVSVYRDPFDLVGIDLLHIGLRGLLVVNKD